MTCEIIQYHHDGVKENNNTLKLKRLPFKNGMYRIQVEVDDPTDYARLLMLIKKWIGGG